MIISPKWQNFHFSVPEPQVIYCELNLFIETVKPDLKQKNSMIFSIESLPLQPPALNAYLVLQSADSL